MLYPFDPSGASSKNRITDEIHAVSPPDSIGDTSFIVPRITPFFADRLDIRLGSRDLVEGVDYVLVFRHLSLSTHLTMRVFGGIAFRNPEFTGTVKISYQTVGGDFQLGDKEILEKLSQKIGRVHYVTFDQIVGTPSSFPPEDHYHDLETGLVNMGDVVDSIEQLSTELGKNPGSLAELSIKLRDHMSKSLSHTKEQVGLGSVANLPVGTEGDLTSGKKRSYVVSNILYDWMVKNLAWKNDIPSNVGSASDISENGRLIDSIGTKLGRLETKVELLAKSIGKISTIEKSIASLKNTVGNLSNVTEDISSLDKLLNTLKNQVDAIPPPTVVNLTTIKNDIKNLKNSVSGIPSLVNRIKALENKDTDTGSITPLGTLLARVSVAWVGNNAPTWGSRAVRAKVINGTVDLSEGGFSTPPAVTLPSNTSGSYSRPTSYVASYNLPAWFDSAKHKVVVPLNSGFHSINVDISNKKVSLNFVLSNVRYVVSDKWDTVVYYYTVNSRCWIEIRTK